MENQVIQLSGEKYKSLGLTDKRLYINQKSEKDFKSLEKRCQDVSDTSEGTFVYLEKLSSINMNTGSASIKLKYLDYRKKDKSISFNFSNKEKSLVFAKLLADKLGLQQHSEQEKEWLPLLKNLG